jgi:hypothetical protein
MMRVFKSSAEAIEGVIGMMSVTMNRSLLRIARAKRATSAAAIWLHGPCLPNERRA